MKLEFFIRESQQRGKGFWKFNNSLLQDRQFINIVKETVQNSVNRYSDLKNYSLLWDVVKCDIRAATISYATWKNKHNKKTLKELENRLSLLEVNLNESPNMYNEYLAVRHEFEDLNNEIAKGIFVRSKVKNIEENEKCTKFFMQQEVKNYKTKHIKCLKIDTIYEKNPDKILSEQEKFYKNLYSKPADSLMCEENCTFFKANIPAISEDDKSFCDQNLTIEECGRGLKELPNNKSLGSDGLTTEFYKIVWTDMKDLVCKSYSYAFPNGILSIDKTKGRNFTI